MLSLWFNLMQQLFETGANFVIFIVKGYGFFISVINFLVVWIDWRTLIMNIEFFHIFRNLQFEMKIYSKIVASFFRTYSQLD